MARFGSGKRRGDSDRALRTAAVAVVMLAVGIALLALIGAALKVSDLAGFGVWGAVVVVGVTALTTLVVWIWSGRKASRQGGTSGETAPTGRVVELPTPLAEVLAGNTATPTLPAPSNEEPALLAEQSVSSNDRDAYYRALEGGELDAAARIVTRLRATGENPQWCDNAERRIAHLRHRP